jgi:hypothetical protein
MTDTPRKPSARWLLVTALVVIVVLAAVASLLASHSPDGLTKVSEQQGFAQHGRTRHGPLSYGPVAGVVGMLVVLALAGGLTRLARRRAAAHRSDDPHRTVD